MMPVIKAQNNSSKQLERIRIEKHNGIGVGPGGCGALRGITPISPPSVFGLLVLLL